MSILPVYLCSFSNVAPLQRGVSDHKGLDSLARGDIIDGTGKVRQSTQDTDEDSKRSHGTIVARNGDVVSDYGDVFSASKTERSDKSTQSSSTKYVTTKELTDDELLQVAKLKQQDAEVKAHEAAHLGAAGGLARGGASYEYQKGPDGQNYAVGGEVSIDSSPVHGNPEATISKAQQIRSAALAPANPSSQDYKVAAKASQIEAEARQELAKSSFATQESQENESSDSSDMENNKKSAKSDNSTVDQSSQYHSQTAVMKYLVNSQNMTLHLQGRFQGFA